jgi:hypothetical protein
LRKLDRIRDCGRKTRSAIGRKIFSISTLCYAFELVAILLRDRKTYHMNAHIDVRASERFRNRARIAFARFNSIRNQDDVVIALLKANKGIGGLLKRIGNGGFSIRDARRPSARLLYPAADLR